jgi:hypothetical protein
MHSYGNRSPARHEKRGAQESAPLEVPAGPIGQARPVQTTWANGDSQLELLSLIRTYPPGIVSSWGMGNVNRHSDARLGRGGRKESERAAWSERPDDNQGPTETGETLNGRVWLRRQ